MLKLGKRIFIKETFRDEAEIDTIVSENSDYIFGASSIFLPKFLIKTEDGAGTIPDGFAIDLATKQWFIVEAELAKHQVWSHIAPQISKQITASKKSTSKKMIAKILIDKVKDDKVLLEKLNSEGILPIHIHQVISEILEKSPIIGLPIDEISEDLKDWAGNLKYEVKLWRISKYVEFGHPENVLYEFPEESRPTFDTKTDGDGTGEIAQYDVKIIDLINADLLQVGQSLFMSYKPQSGSKQDFEAIIQGNGALKVLAKSFDSPSYASLFCIQAAGSPRKTVNGWNSWKDSNGVVLSKIREKYLKEKITL